MPLLALKYRTEDIDKWGVGEGADLEPVDVDTNFWLIAEAILDLQDNPPDANGIASISEDGLIVMDDSTEYQLALPVAERGWRGEWAATTVYVLGDWFKVTGTGIFAALQNHTSGATFDAGATGGDPVAALYIQIFGADVGSIYDFQVSLVDTPIADEIIDRIPITRTIRIPADFAGSVASGGTNPDATFEISVQDDAMEIGTITISDAGVVTFATASGTVKDVAAGSILTLVAPNPSDASVEGWSFGIAARVFA